MNAAAFLSAVVDIAIGIAGFAGIVAAIRQRKLSKWPPEQLILLQILFTASAAAAIAGLLPSFLMETGLSEQSVWRFSSAALLCWAVGALTFRFRQSRKYGVRQQIPKFVVAWGITSIILQLVNIAMLGVAWPYLFGVMTMLINGFSVFLILVLRPTEDDA